MSGFDKLVEERADTSERHQAASEFFLSLKEKNAGKAKTPPAKAKAKVQQVARDETKSLLARGGVSTTSLSPKTRAKKISANAVTASPGKVKQIASMAVEDGPKIKDLPKMKLKKSLKNKYATTKGKSLVKQALVERLIRRAMEGGAAGAAKAKGLWSANKDGLSGVMHGATTPRPGKWDRLKAWATRGKTPTEGAAIAKGPKFHEGWVKGQELNRVAGLTDSQKIFLNTVRDPSGKVTPSSMYRGLEALGILTPQGVTALGAKAHGAVKELGLARKAEKIRKRNMMLGAGAVGVGAVALMKKKKSSESRPAQMA
jgi:hypothetical protein